MRPPLTGIRVVEFEGIGPGPLAGRMTGWGQSGPLAQAAGHDLNYVALSGLLSLSAYRGERPIVPPTVVGDAAGARGPTGARSPKAATPASPRSSACPRPRRTPTTDSAASTAARRTAR